MSMEYVREMREYGYGTLLRAWRGSKEIWSHSTATSIHTPADAAHVENFIDRTYGLMRADRPVRVYRFAEKREKRDPLLHAPYGKDHPSYGSATKRDPAVIDGAWWSPRRPSLLIDNLGYASFHASDVRGNLAICREWSRFDICVEGQLQPDSLFYLGRAAAQSEDAGFWGHKVVYGGGAIQFRMMQGKATVLVTRLYHVGSRLEEAASRSLKF